MSFPARRFHGCRFALACVAALLVAPAAHFVAPVAHLVAPAAQAQTITFLPGSVIDVNACNTKTGEFAVGSHFSAPTTISAYRWSDGGGLQNVGLSTASPTVALYTDPEIGSVVVGWGTVGTTIRAFWWHPNRGMTTFGTFGGSDSVAYCTSAFGEVTVGAAHDANDQFHAFRSVDGQPIEDLGTLGGFTSSAYFVSQNGFTIVGDSTLANGEPRAFVWNELDGMINCGSFSGGESYCTRCSEDGTAVLGRSLKKDGKYYAFRWTDRDRMISLGSLGGKNAEAQYASIDGEVVAGTAQNKLQDDRAFRWTREVGMRSLGTLGGAYSRATGITADGRLIVGVSQDKKGRRTAFVSGGSRKKMRSLEDVLKDVFDREDLEGLHFIEPRALSRDGLILYVTVGSTFGPAIVQISLPQAQLFIAERPTGQQAALVSNAALQYAYQAYVTDSDNLYAQAAYAYANWGYSYDLQAAGVTYDWWEKDEAKARYNGYRSAMQYNYYVSAYYSFVDYNYVSGNPWSYYAAVYSYYAYQYGLADLQN